MDPYWLLLSRALAFQNDHRADNFPLPGNSSPRITACPANSPQNDPGAPFFHDQSSNDARGDHAERLGLRLVHDAGDNQ